MLSCLSASLLNSFTCLSFVPPGSTHPFCLVCPFLCLPDNLSFFLLSLTVADFLYTLLSLCCSERQPVYLLVRFSLIYYLCLSVFLYLPSSQPMFLSDIPTCKSTQTDFSPCCSVYSCPSLASVHQAAAACSSL